MSKPTAVKACESIAEPSLSGLATHKVNSVQNSVCPAQSVSVGDGKRSLVLQQSKVDESCVKTKANKRYTVDSVMTAENGSMTHVTNLVTDPLLSCGFNAADWLDDSFTDQNLCTDTMSCPPSYKDDKSTKSCFKIFEDRGRSDQQNAISQTSSNSNTKVLRDRTNVVYGSLQMSTKNTLSRKRTKENDKSKVYMTEKTNGVCCIQEAAEIVKTNSADNSVKLSCQPGHLHADIHASEASSKICNEGRHVNITASSGTISVTRTELSAANTVVTASCQLSCFASSTVAFVTSAAVVFNSGTTASRVSVPNSVTFMSPVSYVTICTDTMISESVKCQPVGSIQSVSSSSAAPKIFSSSLKTPQNQSSVTSSCNAQFSTPGVMVTPCNQPVQNSTMRPTPPMCNCGCRAKRKFVQSPGQNMGRPFYCCGSSRRTPRSGCNFFKWENSPCLSPFAYSLEVTPMSTKQFLSMQTHNGNRNFTTPLSNYTRQATSSRILVPPSFR